MILSFKPGALVFKANDFVIPAVVASQASVVRRKPIDDGVICIWSCR